MLPAANVSTACLYLRSMQCNAYTWNVLPCTNYVQGVPRCECCFSVPTLLSTRFDRASATALKGSEGVCAGTSGWSRTSSDCPAVVLRYTTLVPMPQLPLSQVQHLHHVIHYNAGTVLTYLLYNSCNVSIICSTLSCHYATMSCMLHALL